MDNRNDQIRIVQETVAGKEITLAHVMEGEPEKIILEEAKARQRKGLRDWEDGRT